MAGAVEREHATAEVAVPRPLSGRRLSVLWLVVAAVMAAGFLVFFAVDGPLFRQATAVVVDRPDGVPRLAVFLPPGDLATVHVGQELFLLNGGFADGVQLKITGVERQLLSPDEAARRFGLGVASATVVTQASAVAYAAFPPIGGRSPTEYVGGVYPAVVEIGRKPPGLVIYDAFTNRQVS